MRPKNVHRKIFPNALTSFAAEDRSRDHFSVILSSFVVFRSVEMITSNETTNPVEHHLVVKRSISFFTVASILFNGSVDYEYCSVYNALKDYI